MGAGKLNVMRKTLPGHNNRSSHLIVDFCTKGIVSRPANRGGKVKNEHSSAEDM